jgi:hypothetical protein
VIATKAAMGAGRTGKEIDEPCLDLADMWLVVPRPRFAVGGPDWPVTKQTVN